MTNITLSRLVVCNINEIPRFSTCKSLRHDQDLTKHLSLDLHLLRTGHNQLLQRNKLLKLSYELNKIGYALYPYTKSSQRETH